ncbi:MAG: lipopolysaccharide heptosyltransferase II [Planctomycetota bacterium]
MTPLRRILVRCPNWVGDVVMATPAIRALRLAHPEARIDLAIKRYAAPVLAGWSRIDGIVELGPELGRGMRRVLRTARLYRAGDYDAILLLTNSLGTALEARLAGIPRRVGYAGEGRSPLLTERLPRGPKTRFGYREPEPMVDFYLRAAERLGARADDLRYELEARPEDEAFARAWLERHDLGDRPLIGLNPGAKFGSSKLWSPERFAAAADALVHETGGVAVVLGGPGEEPLLADIAGRMKERVVDSGRDLVPLGPLKALLPHLALLVTTDTGTRAMAQALGVPTVVVMGATHPGWTARNLERSRVLIHDVPCGPCHLKTCPQPTHRCMDLISVPEVIAAARGLLARSD